MQRKAHEYMTSAELVIVPAHPRIGDACRVEFEVRGPAGESVLPVFSNVDALVRVLGRYQPWVCVPLAVAREAAVQAGLTAVVLDPEVGSSGPRWVTSALRAAGGGEEPRHE